MRAILVAAVVLAACGQASQRAPDAPSAARTELATLATPLQNARVGSPLAVTGIAPGDWYFEAVFPVVLLGPKGETIAEAHAQAQTDWMTEGPKTFRADLEFTVAAETPATLVLQEDMPGEGVAPREVRVPVVLTPEP